MAALSIIIFILPMYVYVYYVIQIVNAIWLVRPLCNVMTRVNALARKDSLAASVTNVWQMSLVIIVIHVSQTFSIIQPVKVSATMYRKFNQFD